MDFITYEQEGFVGVITINRPKALNALNSGVLDELNACLDAVDLETTRALVLTGAGEKSFVAGADIAEMHTLNAMQGRELALNAQKVFSQIEQMPQIVIAAVNGYALGGGCELSMACDLRVASEKAKFGQPEVNLGILPGFAGTQRLPRLVGKGIAKELIFTTDMIDAQRAYEIGLANKVVKHEELMEEAEKLARKIMTKGMFGVSLAKSAINNGMNMDMESAYKYEADMFGLCFATEDQKEGMDAFLNKRKAEFKNF